MSNAEKPDLPALVEVVAVPNLVEAERIAARLRDAGIPAILDPKTLAELHAGGYRDVHLAFPVLVPGHYETEAVRHLESTVHRPQGDADPEAVLAAWESDDEPLPVESSRRWNGLLLLFLMLALFAFGLYVLFPGGP